MSQIMKKAILTFGLFSMIMVLTSFTSPQEIGGSSAPDPRKPTPVMSEIGGSSAPVPQPKGMGITDIGGSSAPKPRNLGVTEIGGSSAPVPQPKGLGLS